LIGPDNRVTDLLIVKMVWFRARRRKPRDGRIGAVTGLSTMRVHGLLILLAGFTAAEAQAASIQTVAPLSGVAPSIQIMGDTAAIDPSIVAATPDQGEPTPSITVLADTRSDDTPSFISLGDPAPAGEELAATPSASGGRQVTTMPMVIRGGDVSNEIARPSASASSGTSGDTATTPLLDPNDKGTPSKRKALKRQAARLAQEKASGNQAEPSTDATPMGQ
jgi:hypothetical protein